jgi:hypothetical protein
MLRKMDETKPNEVSTASPTASPTALSTFLRELKKRKSVNFEIVVDNPKNGSSMPVYRKPARVKSVERWLDQTFQEAGMPSLPRRRESNQFT